MKDILRAHLEQVKTDILTYLSNNSEYFNDKCVIKFLKILNIDDGEELRRQETVSRIQALEIQLRESNERYDLKWLSILLLNLNNEDYQEVAVLFEQLDYDQIDPIIIYKLNLLRRLARVIYWETYEEIIPALELLMQHSCSGFIDTEPLLWAMYHQDFDGDKSTLLINMCNTIIKHKPDDYNAYFFKGFLFVEMEQFKEALEAHQACLIICQNNQGLQDHISWECMRIADCYLSLKNYEKTIEYSTAALESFEKFNANEEFEIPFFQAVYTLRNKAYLNLKHYQLALNDINQLLVYSPRDKSIRQLKKKVEKFC